eukprot:164186_1
MSIGGEYSTQWSDYTLKESIGKGTFGVVYRGIHEPNQAEIAIKIIEMNKLKKTPNGMQRVKMEIELQQKLNHDGIIKLFSSFVHIDKEAATENYVLILEYCSGGTLHDYLKKQKCGKLSESHSYLIFAQLVDIVRYLHQSQVIHRDLKLSNALVMNNSSSKQVAIKLCDFGLATSTKASPDHYTWCGTPNFCAPEIAKHEKHGYLVDVWSLG